MVKILIVEDELIIAEDVRNMLTKMDYEILGNAMDYQEAIDLLEQTTPDLILLDVNLGSKKDGIDLAEEINAKYKIPFIFTTSYSDTQTLSRAKSTKPLNYLVKPFKEEQLFTAIEMALYQLSETPAEEAEDSQALIIKDALFLKDKCRYTKLQINDILWIKSDGNYLEIQTLHKTELIRGTLSNFIERLNQPLFFKTHKSYVVNLAHMSNLESHNITIHQTKLPIAKPYYEELVRKLQIL